MWTHTAHFGTGQGQHTLLGVSWRCQYAVLGQPDIPLVAPYTLHFQVGKLFDVVSLVDEIERIRLVELAVLTG